MLDYIKQLRDRLYANHILAGLFSAGPFFFVLFRLVLAAAALFRLKDLSSSSYIYISQFFSLSFSTMPIIFNLL